VAVTIGTLQYDGVFEGGGVKGIGLIGALGYLEGRGYKPQNLAGTSAGAIVATLHAAGYEPDELKSIIGNLDFRKFEDSSLIGRIPIAGPIINVLERLGIYKGDYFLGLMRDLLGAKRVRTFKDLVIPGWADDPRYRYRVRVVASDITRGCMLILPQDVAQYGLVPDDLEVAVAVRMSMSIPLFFRPVSFKSSEGKSHLVVDGGVLSNFPVELFDSPGEPAWPTFGFRLTQPGSPPMERYHIGGPISMLAAMFGTMMEAHDARYIETHNFVRSITIDPVGIATTQFDLTATQKEALYKSGVAAAEDFLSRWDFEAYKALFRSGSPPPSRRDLSTPALAASTWAR
jgi:NTE family protein